MNKSETIRRIKLLEKELSELRQSLHGAETELPKTVMVPEAISDLFAGIEAKVDAYFDDFHFDPVSGEITVHGQRYVLFRTDSMSHEFMEFIKERYSDRPEQEAISIGNNFLYDNAKVIGKKDAVAFHKNLNLKQPLEKLSAGPIHFAFTGWANVEIYPDSNPVADETYFLKFQHHNSFEAQSWIKAGKKSDIPVCTMNCGYSAGWCEESFGIPLTTVEISCEAQGADACLFIMAPTDKIEQYVEKEVDLASVRNFEIPVFFNRIIQEEKLKDTLQQKELLIQEIHHRVKNNLQVISSLLRLQMSKRSNEQFKDEFNMSINRVNTMAAVHELLYQRENFDQIDVNSYFTELTQSFVNFYAIDHKNIEVELKIDVHENMLNLEKTIPIALIMNEVTCNAFKHALHNGGKFYLYLWEEDRNYILKMGDDGPGYAIDENNDGLGLSLIDILCDQLDATKEVSNTKNGLEYRLTIPVF